MTDKVKIVRDYHDLLNAGQIAQANAHLAHNLTANFSVGGPQLNKEEVGNVQQGVQNALNTTTLITEAKEVDGKVVVVGKSLLKLKVEEVPFKAVYEFNGNQIGAVKFETDPSFQVKAFSI
ncbi:hypothetical protein K435DRAFT_971516 [Dendrothele bispora CBS 962.96]|uniref:Nuclear transport factor 2 family protein n=1 Tax=Dendrothele bispora (strain CBS 962.96) TaxID=1314807 RepID=A0A4S8L552_DENBC|nr:hypothetical protein K435DRAFT_971516 [Dendrothele bispora CBS 962.96]